MARRKQGIIACLLCICLWLLPCLAWADSTADAKESISPDKDCTLTLSYCCDGTAIYDLPVKLYHIATVSADFQYTLTPTFATSGLVLNGIQTSGEWNVIRSTLETYIVADSIAADMTGETGEEGKVSFEPLKPGLYLAIVPGVEQDDLRCTFDSALVAVPGLGTDGLWQYQVDAVVKPQIQPPIDPEKEIELRVVKLWKGDSGYTDRPEDVEVEIFRNEESYQLVLLSEENNWSYSWMAKDDGAIWTVVERNVPDGYTMTVEERETTFVLTNTRGSDTPPEEPPKTGDTTNVLLYAILMCISGTMLILLGLIEKRK